MIDKNEELLFQLSPNYGNEAKQIIRLIEDFNNYKKENVSTLYMYLSNDNNEVIISNLSGGNYPQYSVSYDLTNNDLKINYFSGLFAPVIKLLTLTSSQPNEKTLIGSSPYFHPASIDFKTRFSIDTNQLIERVNEKYTLTTKVIRPDMKPFIKKCDAENTNTYQFDSLRRLKQLTINNSSPNYYKIRYNLSQKEIKDDIGQYNRMKEPSSHECILRVEETPEFPGGSMMAKKFINQNLSYPQSAKYNSIQGRVFLAFDFDIFGRISNIKVVKGIGYGCDEEAIRIIKKMPNWLQKCDVWRLNFFKEQEYKIKFHFPVSFSLNPK